MKKIIILVLISFVWVQLLGCNKNSSNINNDTLLTAKEKELFTQLKNSRYGN